MHKKCVELFVTLYADFGQEVADKVHSNTVVQLRSTNVAEYMACQFDQTLVGGASLGQASWHLLDFVKY